MFIAAIPLTLEEDGITIALSFRLLHYSRTFSAARQKNAHPILYAYLTLCQKNTPTMGSFSWLAVTGPANAKAATYANIVANHILEKFVARPILYAMSKNCSTRQMFLGTSLRPFGVCKEREG